MCILPQLRERDREREREGCKSYLAQPKEIILESRNTWCACSLIAAGTSLKPLGQGWDEVRREWRIDPWNCSWAGFLSGHVADNRAKGWMDFLEWRKWERSCSADGEFHSWSPKYPSSFLFSSCAWNSAPHSLWSPTPTCILSARFCSLSLLNLGFS